MRPAKNAVDVGIVASRISEMLEFYRDTLGLQYIEAFTSAVGVIHRLQFGSSFIKIVDVSAASSVPRQEPTYGDAGLRYMTFETPDIESTWQRAIDAGAPVVLPLLPLPAGAGRAGTVRDPEGNLVELLQRGEAR